MPDPPASQTMSVASVQVRDLSVSYAGRVALHGISFEAETGSFISILGPNGSGKTTLIKALLGIIRPTAGSVMILGRDPAEADPGEVGYVPQVKTLERQFPATALELVVSGARRSWPALIKREERTRAVQTLERVGAGHLSGRPLSELSGGELQRVYLARSFIRRPRVMMLDEPATGVDMAGASDLYELLDAYQREHEATVLMVTHDWNVAYHHSTGVLLLNGEQISFGAPDDVLTESNLRTLFGHVGHSHAMVVGSDEGHDHANGKEER